MIVSFAIDINKNENLFIAIILIIKHQINKCLVILKCYVIVLNKVQSVVLNIRQNKPLFWLLKTLSHNFIKNFLKKGVYTLTTEPYRIPMNPTTKLHWPLMSPTDPHWASLTQWSPPPSPPPHRPIITQLTTTEAHWLPISSTEPHGTPQSLTYPRGAPLSPFES